MFKQYAKIAVYIINRNTLENMRKSWLYIIDINSLGKSRFNMLDRNTLNKTVLHNQWKIQLKLSVGVIWKISVLIDQ